MSDRSWWTVKGRIDLLENKGQSLDSRKRMRCRTDLFAIARNVVDGVEPSQSRRQAFRIPLILVESCRPDLDMSSPVTSEPLAITRRARGRRGNHLVELEHSGKFAWLSSSFRKLRTEHQETVSAMFMRSNFNLAKSLFSSQETSLLL